MDYLIRKTSNKLEIKEDIVDKVIRHQWREAYKAASSKDQIEVTGIGYWFTSPQKIKSRLEKLERILVSVTTLLQRGIDPEKYTRYKAGTEAQIAHLNKRLEFHEDRLERTRTRSLQHDSGEEVDQGTSDL